MIWISSKWGGRLLPGTLTAIAIAGLLKIGLFDPLEQNTYRLLFQLRGSLPADQRLVMIEIDDASLEHLGRFPWSRQQYAKLLNLLDRPDTAQPQPIQPGANNNIVVLDLLFSESSPSDAQLAEAMKRHGQVVLASAWDADGKPLMPVPQLRYAAIATGHILVQPGSDGMVHSVIPLLKGQPILGVAAMQARNLVQAKVTLPPLDRLLWLNWVGSAHQAPHYSFIDVIEGKVNPQIFHNKIVLVGVTATGIDPLISPFNPTPPSSSLYLHATLIQNLLQQNLLHPLHPIYLLLLLLSAPLCSWSLAGRGLTRQISGTVGLCGGWGIFSFCLFHGGYLAPIAAPVAMFAMIGCATALSDRTRETGRLQRQLQHIQQNGLFKDEFLRTATHELRSPVVNMQNVLTLLKLLPARSNLEQYIDLLETECQREMELVNDLLDLQRLEASVETGQLETIHWHDWLEEVSLPFLVRANLKQQTLALKVAPNLPTVLLEETSLRRLLAELLNNACKYSPAQTEIGILAQFQAPEIVIQIYNTGAEILPENLTRIFEPFYRAPNPESQESGTGLGLAIVKKLAERLGGKIEVTSRSQTTTFTFRFPIDRGCISPNESAYETRCQDIIENG